MTPDDLFAAAFELKMKGQSFEARGEKERGAEYFEREYRLVLAASKLGSGKSMMILAELIQGQKVAAARALADPVGEAIEWWKKASENGDTRGWTNIGLLYLHEKVPGGGADFGNVPYDPDQAFKCFMRSFEMGDTKAGRHVGRCYLNGWGVEKDEKQAYKFFRIAADRHDSTATLYCEECLLKGIGTEQDTAKAIEIYKDLVARKGHDITTGAYALGCIYRDGVYAEKDEKLSAKYFRIAADTATAITADLREKALTALGE